MEQETFIYIDEKEKYDASVVANTFIDNSVKNRVYINTLGAELGMKYLNSENIDTSGLKNMHSIKKVIGEFDIADIMLKGIHIDVRVVFDENAIFVPKSHFEYNILPDIYLVFKIEKEQSRVRFLGFFEPKLINKNNANKDYYFIEKEKLNSALDLLQYIEKHKFSNDINLSENEIESAENLIISMADNDISDSDKKHLLEQLIKSIELRDKFIEYENFETLSYKAMSDSSVDKHSIAKDVTPIDEFAEFEDTQAVDNTDDIADTLEINEEINNDTESVEQITEEEQEFFTDNLEGIDSLQENDIELQNDNFEAMQENINSEGFDLDDAIETLDASAGAEAAPMIPSPPAFDTAAARLCSATHAMPPCMMGYSVLSKSVILFFIFPRFCYQPFLIGFAKKSVPIGHLIKSGNIITDSSDLHKMPHQFIFNKDVLDFIKGTVLKNSSLLF